MKLFLGPRTVLAVSVTSSLKWFHFSPGPPVSGPIALNLSSRFDWNPCLYLAERSLAVLRACLMNFLRLWCSGTMRVLRLALMSLWSVQHSAPRIALVMRTSLLSLWRVIMQSMRRHCFKRGWIHDVLYLSISRLSSAHLFSNRRSLLFTFSTPCFPISPLHRSTSMPTLALKSLISSVHVIVGAYTLMMVMNRLSLIGRPSFIILSFTPVGRLGLCLRSLDLMANPTQCIFCPHVGLAFPEESVASAWFCQRPFLSLSSFTDCCYVHIVSWQFFGNGAVLLWGLETLPRSMRVRMFNVPTARFFFLWIDHKWVKSVSRS